MNRKNLLTTLIFINAILLPALLVLLIFLPIFAAREPAPLPAEEPAAAERITVDTEALLTYAEQYQVSIEYLQKILPDYLVYKDGQDYVFQPADPAVPKHTYHWEYLTYAHDRIYYPDARCGIDVSEHQGEIDWQAVAADGIDFAMIRVGYRGYGSGAPAYDSRYEENIEGALAAGLPVGVYFFSQAIDEDEAKEEAEMLLNAIDNYAITGPVVFDMEEITTDVARTDDLTREEVTAIAAAFVKKVKKAGYTPMLYGNTKWLAQKLDLAEFTETPVWFAQYYSKPLFPYAFAMWQYSSTGKVDGIAGNVDLNLCFTPWE